MLPYMLVLFFSLADHLLTHWEIQQGIAREGNPLMAYVFALPLEKSLPLRMAWFVLLLWLLRRLSLHKPILVSRCLIPVAVIYFCLVLYHGMILVMAW